MLSRISVAWLAISSVASAAIIPRSVCNADNCLRSLRATQIATRVGAASSDCTRVLYETYTPPTVTRTDYSTVRQTDVSTIQATLTNTLYDTSTSVVQETTTVIAVSTVTQDGALVKRAQPSLPAYASFCSGIVRFSSACSCIGVTAVTITVAAPTTIVTSPFTVIDTTSTTRTIDTTSITITDATETQTTVDGTTTSWSVTTVAPTGRTIKIQQYYNDAPQPIFVGYNADQLNFGSNAIYASEFVLKTDSKLWYGNKIAAGLSGNTYGQIKFFPPTSLLSGWEPYSCTTDQNGVLKCSLPTKPDLVFLQNSGVLGTGISGTVAQNQGWNGPIELRVYTPPVGIQPFVLQVYYNGSPQARWVGTPYVGTRYQAAVVTNIADANALHIDQSGLCWITYYTDNSPMKGTLGTSRQELAWISRDFGGAGIPPYQVSLDAANSNEFRFAGGTDGVVHTAWVATLDNFASIYRDSTYPWEYKITLRPVFV